MFLFLVTTLLLPMGLLYQIESFYVCSQLQEESSIEVKPSESRVIFCSFPSGLFLVDTTLDTLDSSPGTSHMDVFEVAPN